MSSLKKGVKCVNFKVILFLGKGMIFKKFLFILNSFIKTNQNKYTKSQNKRIIKILIITNNAKKIKLFYL